MSAILEIPEVRQRVSKLSVREYHDLHALEKTGRRTELIRRIVIDKMSKSPLRQALGQRLYDLIKSLLPPGFVARREAPLTIAADETIECKSVPGIRLRIADLFE